MKDVCVLLVTYEDHKVSFEELLEMDNSLSIHCKTLQCLAIELYKLLMASCYI